MSFLTEVTIDGIALWVVALICLGVFIASLMDGIAGGGGIISLPTYIMAFHGLPMYYMLGTNKLSSCLGTFFSTARFIKNGYVTWGLAAPAIAFSWVVTLKGLSREFLAVGSPSQKYSL